jgi:hypothetical protein
MCYTTWIYLAELCRGPGTWKSGACWFPSGFIIMHRSTRCSISLKYIGTSECSLAAIIMKTGCRTRQDTAVARGLCVRTRGRERGGEQLCWEGDGDVRGSNHAAHRPCIAKIHIQLACFACVGLCNITNRNGPTRPTTTTKKNHTIQRTNRTPTRPPTIPNCPGGRRAGGKEAPLPLSSPR